MLLALEWGWGSICVCCWKHWSVRLCCFIVYRRSGSQTGGGILLLLWTAASSLIICLVALEPQ